MNKEKFMNSLQNIKQLALHIAPKALICVLLFWAFTTVAESSLKLLLFLGSGIVSGSYHGLFTLSLWREKDINKHLERENVPYETNTLWIHIISGLIASMGLYLLSAKINLINPIDTINNLGIADLVVFIFVLVGYAGLLPRTLWFWSYSGKLEK